MAHTKTARQMADGWREIVSELRAEIQKPTATEETYSRFEAAKRIWYAYENVAPSAPRATFRRARR
jgi:hypothetical protein